MTRTQLVMTLPVRVFFALVVLVGSQAACTGEEKAHAPTTPVAAATSATPSAPANKPGGGGGVDTRARLVVTSPLRESSAIGATPSFTAILTCARSTSCVADPEAFDQAVASRALLRGPSGTIALVPANKAPSSDGNGKQVSAPNAAPSRQLTLVAAAALADDTDYTLSVLSDSTVLSGFIDDSGDEEAAIVSAEEAIKGGSSELSISLFTGSLPHLTALSHSNDPKKDLNLVRLHFSEPMVLGSLAKAGISFQGLIAGCLLDSFTGGCVSAGEIRTTTDVEFMFEQPVSSESLSVVSISIGDTALGVNRTLAEATKYADPNTASSGTVSAVARKWFSCDGHGTTLCARIPPIGVTVAP